MNLDVCQDLLVSLALRSTIGLGLLCGALYLARHRSAAFRCALLSTGMAALALLPLTWCLPRVEISWFPFGGQEATSWFITPSAETASVIGPSLIALWFLGIGLLAALQSLGLWQLQRWRERSVPLESGYWQGFLGEITESLAYRGKVKLYLCPHIHSPAAAGITRPCVFLPPQAIDWDRERLHVVLLHEVGHLKRRDLWTQWLSQLVCALYWFHPLVWFLGRKLHHLREFACDHTVLNAGAEPSHYARELVELARNLKESASSRRWVMANGLFLAMASESTRGSLLEARVRAILSFRSSTPLSCVLGLGLAMLALATSWATATFSPKHPSPVDPFPRGSQAAAVEHSSNVITPAEVHLRLTASPFPGNP